MRTKCCSFFRFKDISVCFQWRFQAPLGQVIINLHFCTLGFVVTLPSDFPPLILCWKCSTVGCKVNGKKEKRKKNRKKQTLGKECVKSPRDERWWSSKGGLWLFELENGWDKYSQHLRCPYCTEAIFPVDSWIITCPLEMQKAYMRGNVMKGDIKEVIKRNT